MIVSDNGTELTSHAILRWQEERGVLWHYIAPGLPDKWAAIREMQTRFGLDHHLLPPGAASEVDGAGFGYSMFAADPPPSKTEPGVRRFARRLRGIAERAAQRVRTRPARA